MITRSVVARRLMSGIYVGLRVEVTGEDPTEWPVNDANTDAPFSIIDGVRYDLKPHEVRAIRRAVAEVRQL